MKGIAVCARYLNNISNYLTEINTLPRIVQFVENIKPIENTISFAVQQVQVASAKDVRLNIRGLSLSEVSKLKVSIYDETADVKLVATSDIESALNISLTSIYRHFILDSYYRVQIIVFGTNNSVGYKDVYITWPYDNTNSGGGDTGDWPNPQLEFIDGKLYVSNYTNGTYNCRVDIDYYDSMDNLTDARTEETYIENGYSANTYYDGGSFSASLAIYKDNGDLTGYSNAVTLG
jgi:hypothetical protein